MDSQPCCEYHKDTHKADDLDYSAVLECEQFDWSAGQALTAEYAQSAQTLYAHSIAD